LPEDLFRIISYLKTQESLSNLRDITLLLIGFFGALRRSELVALKIENIRWDEQGIELLIPHSKTDQLSEGQYCAIPYGKPPYCPIKNLKNWLEAAQITDGFLFRRITNNRLHPSLGLTPPSIKHILK